MRFFALIFLALMSPGSNRPTASMRSTAYYCSFGRLSQYYSPHGTRFIGTATGDSIKTTTRPPSQIRKWANGVKEPPFVQIFRVERLSTLADQSLAQSIKKSGNRVVIVPWSHEPDCRTLSWGGSAIWTNPNVKGLFGVGLRPKSDWINGFPTFDIDPDNDTPYPGASYANGSVNLNASELLSLVDSIPPVPARPDKASSYVDMRKRFEAIFRWGATHPNQANRKPLSEWVESGKNWLVRSQFDTIVSPFAGTYRFVLSVPPMDTVVFYGRSGLRAYDVIWQESSKNPKRALSDPLGYYLIAGIAKTVESLPDTWPAQDRDGVFGASFAPVFTSKDSTVWQGELDVFLSLQKLAGASPLASKLAHIRKVDMDNTDAGTRNYLPARIVRRRNGDLELNLVVKERDSTIATIQGKQVSRTIFTHSR